MTIDFDRSAEDTSNIVQLGHVNTMIPDQRLGTSFYISGLGLTRDPYLNTGLNNMWVNVGVSQFHLPTGKPEVVRGHVGLVVPDRDALLGRLTTVKKDLEDTLYAFSEKDGYIEAVSPWGNVNRIYEPDAQFGPTSLGIRYVELTVPVGVSPAIARFYANIMGTAAEATEDEEGRFARCSVGHHQELIFRETEGPIADYDGHHVQVYIADFSGPYQQLKKRELVSQESHQWQYRFRDITDDQTDEVVFTLDHEVRSMTHPFYARPLVNRDPRHSNRNFQPGLEERSYTTEYAWVGNY